MDALYFEDYEPDASFRTLARTITETDLVNFIGNTGMYESLFMDTEYLDKSMYEGRLVPGALTYGFSEGLIIQTGVIHDRGMAFLGAEIRTENTVYVGDTIHVVVEVAETRATRRTDRGIVITNHRVINQRGEVVMSLRITRMIRARPTTADTDAP